MFGSIGIPHGFCFLWNPGLLWLHVISDSLIALAYYLIPVVLVRIVVRRKDIPFNWMLVCFAAFIIACGTTHILEVVTLWTPIYWVSGVMKAITAVVSLATLFLLVRITPVLLAVPDSKTFAETNEQLALANQRLTSVLEDTSLGVYAIDRSWVVSYMNGTARKLLGKGDEVIGKSAFDVLPGQKSETVDKMYAVMEKREPVEFESYYEPMDLTCTVRVHPWENGGITIFFTDISEQRRLARELSQERALREQRIEALASMAAGLAHEISNPLGIIHARASDLGELAQEEPNLSATDVMAATNSIIRTSDRAMRILRGLRMFAREGTRDSMQPADVAPMVEQTMELVERRYTTHGIELRRDIAAHIPQVLCREVQIGQVLLNLLNNAFDAIDGVGKRPDMPQLTERWVKVLVRRSADTPEVWIDVIDSGPGVSPEDRPHLMEAFFTTKPVGAGIGVGLSLSRAIAQDHGGSLTLVDGEPNTCFRLKLPIRATVAGENEGVQA